MAGHVFVTHSDITKLRCDAWLLPTDQLLWVTDRWISQAPEQRVAELKGKELQDRWRQSGCIPTACEPWRKECGDSPAPTPVLVHTGGTSKTPVSWYREQIRGFVQFTLPRVQQRSPKWRSKPLLAVPMVGTGQGGQFQKKGEMAKAILSELSDLVVLYDFDAVLVVADDAAFAAAQANRLPFDANVISESARRQAELLARQARDGNLVLFLGAGISQQAGLPTWSDLLAQLSDLAGMSDSEKKALGKLPSWLDAASILEARLKSAGREFGEVVADATRSECFGLGHSLAADLSVREAVTTNYDDLFEKANRASGKGLAILPYQPSSSAERWLLKLHGDVEHPEDIVLTRADFMRYQNNRAALHGIVQAMLMTRHILFVGFSLTDDNFHRLVDEVRLALDGRHDGTHGTETKRRAKFGSALVAQKDDLFQSLWSNDLDLLNVGDQSSSKLAIARDVEIILDYVSHRGNSVSAHLLDEAFDGALDASQRRIKAALRGMVEKLQPSDLESQTFAPFARLLEKHGTKSSNALTETRAATI